MAEITLTFDNSRVMYGFCSLKEPNATLPRYILINWVSRGKLCCSQPQSTVSQRLSTSAITETNRDVDVCDLVPSAGS